MNCLNKISAYLVLTLALASASRLSAEKMTLTDKQGRALTADVLAVEMDAGKVKIQRDDGQVFTLPLDNLIKAVHAPKKNGDSGALLAHTPNHRPPLNWLA